VNSGNEAPGAEDSLASKRHRKEKIKDRVSAGIRALGFGAIRRSKKVRRETGVPVSGWVVVVGCRPIFSNWKKIQRMAFGKSPPLPCLTKRFGRTATTNLARSVTVKFRCGHFNVSEGNYKFKSRIGCELWSELTLYQNDTGIMYAGCFVAYFKDISISGLSIV
jgi:hypothetical protein